MIRNSQNQLRFNGKVVIITGAGGGLGKAYALLFASRGAKIVVNDLGGTSHGEGQDSKAADLVVNEIRAAGGIAVPDHHSVEEGEKIVQTALDNFGKIDILINNAGILRDRSFARISDIDWDLVHRVHLRGSFIVTRAAFPHMKKQKYGRIIMTSSIAGIAGNFGQANYSAAKLGVLGLSNTLAIEGRKYNVSSNTIVPMGGTRLTEDLIPKDLFEQLKPELIAPLVLWLCHEECQETGGVFDAAGGWFAKHRWQQSKGVMCRNSLSESVSPEAVRDNWDQICDFSDPVYIDNIQMSSALLFQELGELKSRSKHIVSSPTLSNSSSKPLSIIGNSQDGISFTYDAQNVILYALGVGVSLNDTDGLKFLYEGNDDFCPLPTFAILPSQEALMGSGFMFTFPQWSIDPTKILHGEQYLELVQPIPTSGTLTTSVSVTDVLDKGSGALIILDAITKEKSGNPIIKAQWAIFVVGEGGFKGPRMSEKSIPLQNPPKRNPDAIDSFTTSVDQAALYRLSGDSNPLHIEPNFAAMAGFQQPILHGLCSLGVAARAVLKHFCDNDVSNFKAIKTRFALTVTPGETLVTSMWKEGSRVHFESRVKETNGVSLTGGYVDIAEVQDPEKPVFTRLESDYLIERLGKKLLEDRSDYVLENHVVLWILTKNGKPSSMWTFDFQQVPNKIYEGSPKDESKPSCTFILEDDLLVAISKGEISSNNAVLSGQMKVIGSATDIKKLGPLLVGLRSPQKSKL